MFGMLDYRAHKLLFLLCFPIQVCNWLTYVASIGISIIIANSTGYNVIIKIIIGYVLFEAIGMVLLAFWSLVYWFVKKIFFWIVDVVPSHGENPEEARAVVLMGPTFRLAKKASCDIGNITLDEMTELSRRTSSVWGRFVFKAHHRGGNRLMALWRNYENTGKQPVDLKPAETKTVVGHLEFSSFEQFAMMPAVLRSAFAFVAILLVLIVTNTH
jgi:hypothetical protein